MIGRVPSRTGGQARRVVHRSASATSTTDLSGDSPEVDVAEVVWQARVAAGLSQRQLAAAAGISHGTVGGIESGRRQPSWPLLSRVLDACGLELAVAAPPPELDDADRAYLRLSTSERLYVSLGGRDPGLRGRRVPVWPQLETLRRCGRVSLAPRACVGIWLRERAPEPFPVVLHGTELPVADWSALDVSLDPAPPTTGLIPLGTHPWRPDVLVHTPVSLALCREVAAEAGRLRAVARYLHGAEGLDRRDRRRPAHRVSNPRLEAYDIQHRRAYGELGELPSPTARREWRAGAPVSFSQWLTRNRYADPRPGRRRGAEVTDVEHQAG